MEKTYNPQAIEQQCYQNWEAENHFKASGTGMPYCIMLPPPNVTGTLHMGHGFQQTLMDILIRTHRMMGDNTHWQCGTDHAGIATQMVVERQLGQQGIKRTDLSREDFVQKVWDWKNTSGNQITQQMRRLGASPDWSAERFTMDDGLSDAVKTVFVQLYEEGLIYRGKRLVNWDTHFQTALSDLEVLNEPAQGSLWYINYPITSNPSEHVTIATTRPETLLGDVAVAVHPEDTRYQHLVGQTLNLPLCDRTIPVIADEHVDPEFGTGCVKITPAHDFNDYEMGKRHDLPMISMMTLNGKINHQAPAAYRDMDRFEARKQIVADLESAGLLNRIEPHQLMLPKGDRSGTIVEPMLTDQWYVKVGPLAEPAIEAVESGRIKFIPDNAKNIYYEWMHNIQDWCISRQLWWGHRIPAWYDERDNVYVGRDEAAIRAKHGLSDDVILRQDDDVLDTWFSSALWPFSTLGWPEKTPDLKTFYPTSVLITGFDIIFFWVARMIMFGLKFMDQIPFSEVYIHGLIRDHDGQKMSKSKGNVLDPVDLIDGISLDDLIAKRTTGMMQEHLADKITRATKKHFPAGIEASGTDALRFTFCALASTSRDICFDTQRLTGYRNFCNKLWNAARFVMMQTEGAQVQEDPQNQHPVMNWIWDRFNHCVQQMHQALAQYRFDLLASTYYEFVWNVFCDWFLELTKIMLQPGQSEVQQSHVRYTLLTMLDNILKLGHPIMPFITEAIWQARHPSTTIMTQSYPCATADWEHAEAREQVAFLQTFVTNIRTARSEMNVSPAAPAPLQIQGASDRDKQWLGVFAGFIQALAKVSDVAYVDDGIALGGGATAVIGDMTCAVVLDGLIDRDQERARLGKNLEKLNKTIAQIEKKLANPQFRDNAPSEIVEKESRKLLETKQAQEKLHALLTALA